MPPDCPLARVEGLISEELEGELLLYDTESNLAHALRPEAAVLWRACDGHTNTRALADRCSASPDLVRVTLARLGELGLLEDDRRGDTRRDAFRKFGLVGVGVAAVPTMSSILVPTPAQAASGVMFMEYTIPSGHVPNQITGGPDGALWFTEIGNDQIGRMTTSGQVTEYTIPSGRIADQITAGPDGALWFTETGSDYIGRITTSGQVTEYTIPQIGNDITGDFGALWYTVQGANKVGRITPP